MWEWKKGRKIRKGRVGAVYGQEKKKENRKSKTIGRKAVVENVVENQYE